MSGIYRLALHVSAVLEDYHAVVDWCPDYKLSELNELKVIVCPSGMNRKAVTRSSDETEYILEIGVLRRAIESEFDSLLDAVELIASRFRFWRDPESGMTCYRIDNDPVVSVEQARTLKQFTSVLTLHFKGVES